MNVYTHDDHLKDQLRSARRRQYIGLSLVAFSFALSLGAGTNILLIYLAYPFLLVGFPLWTMGRSAVRRLSTTTRADQLINAELKGLSDKYALHHYSLIHGRRVPHVLVTPEGLIVMESSDAAGPVSCDGSGGEDNWKAPSNFLDRLTGLKPPIGNPSRELMASVEAAGKLLIEQGKDEVLVAGLVVFARNPEITVDECNYTAVPMNELRQTIKEIQADMAPEAGDRGRVGLMLTTDDRRRLNSALSPQSARPVSVPAVARK